MDWPYIFLKKSLNYYCKIFGVRGLLWHQGESDLFSFNDTVYQSSLINIINKSREHYGNNLSWMIAKVSRIGNFTKDELKQIQENVANTPNFNCFVGPDTDLIQPGEIYRDDYVHFRGTGFVELADAWYNSMVNTNFLNISTPVAPVSNIYIENNQFVFGEFSEPCGSIYETVSSGDWNNPAIWSCGSVPEITNDVIIKPGHIVNIENYTAYAKSITNSGTLNFSSESLLILGQ
jgi:Carbohydrate esterase, sialic acid-specific acetylesterase